MAEGEDELEEFAISLAQKAGSLLQRHFGHRDEVAFKGKGDRDPVSAADREAETLLRQAIRERFPQHGILGEEGAGEGETESPFLWAIDPLDGTANFLGGLPQFACSVGLLHWGEPRVGAIFVPTSPQGGPGVFHARRGGGAFFNRQRLELASTMPPAPLLLGVPGGWGGLIVSPGPKDGPHLEPRSLGSIAYELCLAACGALAVAIFGRAHLWDVAAGILIVQEAGGAVLWRRRGEKAWRDVAAFPLPQEETALKEWSVSVVVGHPALVPQVARRVRRPPRWFFLALRALGLLRRG